MGTSILSLESVTRRFGDTVAMNQFSASLPSGQLTALLGPNGAGKSTLVALALGRITPDQGNVRVFGGAAGALGARCRTGAMLQSASLPEQLHVREIIDCFRGYYPAPMSLDQVLERCQLGDLSHRRYSELSGGQQRRVQFAVAICGNPQLLLLDEPTVAMDADTRRSLWRVIRELVATGTTVLLTTHQMDEAEALADEVLILAHGRLAARGRPADIKNRVSTRRISCQTHLPCAQIRAWPGVSDARLSGRRIDILCNVAEPIVRRLLEADDSVSGLIVEGSSLEDAIAALVSVGEQP